MQHRDSDTCRRLHPCSVRFTLPTSFVVSCHVNVRSVSAPNRTSTEAAPRTGSQPVVVAAAPAGQNRVDKAPGDYFRGRQGSPTIIDQNQSGRIRWRIISPGQSRARSPVVTPYRQSAGNRLREVLLGTGQSRKKRLHEANADRSAFAKPCDR